MGDDNVAAAIAEAARRLEGVSDTARLDAELLMAHVLGIERSAMLLRMRDLVVPPAYEGLVKRRTQHEPVAYIRGYQDFWDLRLKVTPDVLIPRADSETLIEAAQSHFTGNEEAQRISDLGTGSGALLLAALSLFPDAEGVGIDASPAALAVAQGNASDLGFVPRATFSFASWRDTGWSDKLGQFDLILCNPPYVETDAQLQPSVRDFEPHQALYSGPEGLEDYRILIPQIPALLAPGGVAIFEIGKGQESAVSNLAVSAGLVSTPHEDLAGIVRALSMTAMGGG
jgi:release factor glutamine methyltransferase